MLVASHQIHEVERIADIVAILREGQLCLVEKLETLKAQFREITLTLAGDGQPPPAIGGQVLRECRRGRQWQGLVKNAADDELAGLRGNPAVAAMDVRTPSLEEIMVGYLRHDLPREQVSPTQEVSP